MASKKIKGITIAIGADTSGVTAGLEGITKESVKVSNQLKQVESLLKLDPTNTELLAERERLLGESIDKTREKLRQLEAVQEDVNKQYQEGKIDTSQYIAYQNELVKTRDRLSGLEAKLDETGENFDDLGEDAQTSAKDIDGLSDKLGSGLVKAAEVAAASIAAVGAAVGATVKGIADAAAETAEYGDNIDKASQKIGISAEAYQEWDFILQHSGASADVLQASVKKLSSQMKNAKDVISGTAIADAELEDQLASGAITIDEYNEAYDKLYQDAYKGIDAFDALGISMSELENVGSTEELLSLVVSRLQNMEEGTERTAAATALLGKGAMEMGALFNTSAEDTEAMRQQIHELGGVMSDSAVKDAAAYQDSLQNMETAIDGLKRNISGNFMPSIKEMMDGIAEIFSGNFDGIDTVKEGLNSFGDEIANLAPSIEKFASEVMPALIDAVGSALPDILDLGVSIVGKIGEGIISNLPQITSAGVDLITRIASSILSAVPKIMQAGIGVVKSLASGISSALPELIPLAALAITSMVKELAMQIPQVVDVALDIIDGLVDGILSALPVVISAMPEIINGIIGGLFSRIDDIITAGVDLLTAIIDDLPHIIDVIVAAVPFIISSLEKTLINNSPKIMDAGFKLITAVISDLPQIIATVITAIPPLVAGITNELAKNFPALAKAGFDAFMQLTKNIGEVFRNIRDASAQIVLNIVDSLRAKAGDLWNMGVDLFNNVANGIRYVIGSAWDWGMDLIQNFVNGITGNIWRVTQGVEKVAERIKGILGFSEPEEGPLSNFHTYAPDMMKLFAQGIKENEDLIARQFDDALSKIGVAADITALQAPAVNAVPTVASAAPVTLNVNVSVDSISSNYGVDRMTDRMVENISAGLASLSSRQAALIGG